MGCRGKAGKKGRAQSHRAQHMDRGLQGGTCGGFQRQAQQLDDLKSGFAR